MAVHLHITSAPTVRRNTASQASTASAYHDTDDDAASDYSSSANEGKNLM